MKSVIQFVVQYKRNLTDWIFEEYNMWHIYDKLFKYIRYLLYDVNIFLHFRW